MSSTAFLVLIILVLLVIVYLFLYAKQPHEIPEIIQCSVTKLTPELLSEKQPIILHEPIINVDSLYKTVFAYQYTSKHESDKIINEFERTDSKYTIITPPHKDLSIDLGIPTKTGVCDKFIKVNMQKNQLLIVPPLWYVRCDSLIKKITLDDPVSMIVYKMF